MTTHCGARNRTGGTSGLTQGWGTDHPGVGRCRFHGGSSPNARRAAAEQIERENLERDARALGVPVDVDPLQGVLNQMHITLGELQWMRQVVIAEHERDPESLWRGTMKVTRVEDPEHGVKTTTEAGARLSVRLKTYAEWKRLYRDLVQVVLAHGVAQQVIAIAEQEAETFGALVAAALDAAGVQGDARVAALDAARDRFLLIRGTG